MKELTRIDEIAFSDLVGKAFDADFNEAYPENGRFLKQRRRGRDYWYYKGYEAGQEDAPRQTLRYVGPSGNPDIDSLAEEGNRRVVSYRERRSLASALRSSGLPTPNRIDGQVAEALAKAGLFRLRCTLVGSTAFQAYSGMLGVHLPGANFATDDFDVAQFYGISISVEDKVDDLGQALRSVDESFAPIFDPGTNLVGGFRNDNGFKVEFLTPNRGARELEAKLSEMPALGIGAQPMRFLDFLIRNPQRSVLLHGAGVGVMVPAPERYAIHKLIVSTMRKSRGGDTSKVTKDIRQSGDIIEAMTLKRTASDLGFGWMEAWDRGPGWQGRLQQGASKLEAAHFDMLREAVDKSCKLEGVEMSAYWPEGPTSRIASP